MVFLNIVERDNLIVIHFEKLSRFIDRLVSRFPSSVDKDNLRGEAYEVIVYHTSKYNPSSDSSYPNYIKHRIRGAIIDHLREIDILSRNDRNTLNLWKIKRQKLSLSLGREVSFEEMFKIEGINPNTHQRFLLSNNNSDSSSRFREIDDRFDKDNAPSIEDLIIDLEKKSLISEIIESLNSKQRKIMSLYYFGELTMKKIGLMLNLTESRISQIHKEALIIFKRRFEKIEVLGD